MYSSLHAFVQMLCVFSFTRAVGYVLVQHMVHLVSRCCRCTPNDMHWSHHPCRPKNVMVRADQVQKYLRLYPIQFRWKIQNRKMRGVAYISVGERLHIRASKRPRKRRHGAPDGNIESSSVVHGRINPKADPIM